MYREAAHSFLTQRQTPITLAALILSSLLLAMVSAWLEPNFFYGFLIHALPVVSNNNSSSGVVEILKVYVHIRCISVVCILYKLKDCKAGASNELVPKQLE